ncbi:MAG TPA: EF-hand domain-containing protein [Casimicrobiaceae bacterium]|nr:EF-hand domain-containing protein [Casimicrobiaceae bacterium]
MTLRLKSRLAYGLIVATVALAAATAASGAEPAATGSSANGKPGASSASPSTASSMPGTGDTNMAPRGNDAAATPHTSPGAAGAGDDQAKRIFDQLDLNHDGMLSLDEFSRATFQQPK